MKPFLHNINTDVIHDTRHAKEQCNIDDARKAGHINEVSLLDVEDLLTAIHSTTDELYITLCEHCWPDNV